MSRIEPITIESKIIDLLKETSLSKSEIARFCGVTRGSVQYWARSGKVSKNNLVKLCTILNQDVNSILDIEGTTNSLRPLQEKAIKLIRYLPNSDYYKLEEVVKILENNR